MTVERAGQHYHPRWWGSGRGIGSGRRRRERIQQQIKMKTSFEFSLLDIPWFILNILWPARENLYRQVKTVLG